MKSNCIIDIFVIVSWQFMCASVLGMLYWLIISGIESWTDDRLTPPLEWLSFARPCKWWDQRKKHLTFGMVEYARPCKWWEFAIYTIVYKRTIRKVYGPFRR